MVRKAKKEAPAKQPAKPAAAKAAKPRAKAVAKKATDAPKRPRGRPTRYTPEIAKEICDRIAAGETLRSVCRDERMPAAPTVRSWVLDDLHGFSEQYGKARILLAEHWADEISGIADDGSNDLFIDAQGNERVNAEVVARSRLRVDARKWLLSKVLPKVYGDKLDLNHGIQPDNPLAKLLQQVQGTPMRPTSGKS